MTGSVEGPPQSMRVPVQGAVPRPYDDGRRDDLSTWCRAVEGLRGASSRFCRSPRPSWLTRLSRRSHVCSSISKQGRLC